MKNFNIFQEKIFFEIAYGKNSLFYGIIYTINIYFSEERNEKTQEVLVFNVGTCPDDGRWGILCA